jgi:hypothetical protein
LEILGTLFDCVFLEIDWVSVRIVAYPLVYAFMIPLCIIHLRLLIPALSRLFYQLLSCIGGPIGGSSKNVFEFRAHILDAVSYVSQSLLDLRLLYLLGFLTLLKSFTCSFLIWLLRCKSSV